MPNDKQLARLNQLLNAFDSGAVQPDELIKAIDAIMAVIDSTSKTLVNLVDSNDKTTESKIKSVETKLEKALLKLEGYASVIDQDKATKRDVEVMGKKVAKEIDRVISLIPELPDEFDASDIYKIIEEHKSLLTSLSDLIVGENIRNALEALPEGEKLAIEAVEGLEKRLNDLRQMRQNGATALIARRLDQIGDINLAGLADGDTIVYDAATKTWVPGAGGSGATNFLALTDTPSSYTGQGGRLAAVKVDESGIEFIAPPSGSGDVIKVGTPVNNQVGVWTGDGTIEGDAALTFDTTTDILTTGTVNSTSLTASEIVITDGSKNLVSAAVATYPSLTELTYVKGVTSAIQTQLNAKQATITFGTGVESALGVNVGSAGAVVLFNGALGTPTSGTVTNLTGTASININGTVGATTPAAGTFTTGTFNTSATIATSDTSTTPRLEITQGSTGDAAMRFALSTTRSYAFGIDNSASDSLIISTAASGSAVLGTGDIFTLTTAGALTITGAFSVGTSNSITAGTIELGAASDTTISRSAAGVIAVEGVVIPSISSTNTLTNKRITKRTGTTTSSATPTINTDNVDFYSITAQTVDITSFTTNLSGTPTEGQTLWIAITGTAARAITWGASFEASTVALPTTTVSTNRLDVGFVWNTVTSKWRCIASA